MLAGVIKKIDVVVYPDFSSLELYFSIPEVTKVTGHVGAEFLHRLFNGEKFIVTTPQALALNLAKRFNLDIAIKFIETKFNRDDELFAMTLEEGIEDFEEYLARRVALLYTQPHQPHDGFSKLLFFYEHVLEADRYFDLSDLKEVRFTDTPGLMCDLTSKAFSQTWGRKFGQKAQQTQRYSKAHVSILTIKGRESARIDESYYGNWRKTSMFDMKRGYFYRTLMKTDFQLPKVKPSEVWDTLLDRLYEFGMLKQIEDDFLEAIEIMAQREMEQRDRGYEVWALNCLWLIPRKFILENYDEVVSILNRIIGVEETVDILSNRLDNLMNNEIGFPRR